MTAKELAEKLNDREYGEEITKEEESYARENGLVVVFGASDDLMEFRGAIDDELGAYEGATAHLTREGLLENKCSDDDCPYHEKEKQAAATIKQVWDKDGYSWVYETSIPHETFEIIKNGEKYCRGIVFRLNECGEGWRQ